MRNQGVKHIVIVDDLRNPRFTVGPFLSQEKASVKAAKIKAAFDKRGIESHVFFGVMYPGSVSVNWIAEGRPSA